MNHYDTLEVSPKASPEVIRAAYKSLIQRFHPDRNPGDQTAAERTLRIVGAFEVLSDAVRRAEYDAGLAAPGRVPGFVDPMAPWPESNRPVAARRGSGVAESARRATHRPDGINLLSVMALLAVAFVLVGAWLYFSRAASSNPDKELVTIRQAIASDSTQESERRRLYDRKLEILLEHPDLQRADSAARAQDMAGRTFSLLPVTLVVQTSGAADAGRPALEITLPRVSLLLGTFDAPSLMAHMDKHRERLIGDLAARLAKARPDQLAAADAGKYLQVLVRQSVSASLGHGEAGSYPSTYFESPGRYGVVEVLLPEGFKVIQLAAVP